MKGVIERIISPSETLVIIGNGFDVAHDIKSKYKHFKEYCNFYKKCNGVDELFELNGDWNNIELGLTNYDVIRLLESERYSYDWELRQLYELFLKWVDSLEINNVQPLTHYELHKDSWYLTFNYTETLERIYNIPNSQIFHIHGSRLNKDKNYIFGSGEERDITHLELYSGDFADKYEEIEEIMVTMNLDYTKPIWELSQKVKKLLEDKDIQMIKVHGHSMGKVDWPYFEEIINKVGDWTLWSIDYYNEDDVARIKRFKEEKSLHCVEIRCVNDKDTKNYLKIKDLA